MKVRLTWVLALSVCAPIQAADREDLTPSQAQGKQLYYRACLPCHAPGLWGSNRLARRMDQKSAVLESRTDLTVAAIRTVVRAGLGSMPPYRRTEVSDADVDAIVAYLTRAAR